MSATPHLGEVHISTTVLDGRPSTIITIDGTDVLLLHRSTPRTPGRPAPPAFLAADPVGLLPPDSAALLPTAVPRPAMIGICTCGDAGCASLWLRVRRESGTVIWEPDPDTSRDSIDTTWRFALRQYLDALDAGQRSTQRWEERPHRIARELRRKRDSLFGLTMVDRATRRSIRLLDASAWPARDSVLLTAATPLGVRQFELPVTDDLTNQQISRMVNAVDLDEWT